MKELSPSARRLFELARGQDDPDELARTRVGRALSAMIAAEATLLAAGALAPKSIAAGVGAIAAKYTLVVGVTGALVAAGWLTLRTAQPVARPVASSHQAAPTAPAPPILVEAEPAAVLPAAAPREPSKAAFYRKPARPAEALAPGAAVTEDVLRAETEALRLAQQALRDHSRSRRCGCWRSRTCASATACSGRSARLPASWPCAKPARPTRLARKPFASSGRGRVPRCSRACAPHAGLFEAPTSRGP